MKNYTEMHMDRTRSYLRLGVRYPQLAQGFHWLTRIRLFSFWTARKFAQIGWLPDEFRRLCPFCRQVRRGETVEHFLMECSAWNEARQLYLSGWIGGLDCVWFNLLGGCRSDGGLPRDTLEELWSPRDRTFHPETDLQTGTTLIGNDADAAMPGCAKVSQYLQKVIPGRLRLLHRLLEAPRANADDEGMAVLAVVEGALDANPVPAAVDIRGGHASPEL